MANVPLGSIKWPNLPDRYWVVQADGSYQQMTVGNAEQLVATVGIEDKVPYNFRTAGGSADIGDREVDKVIGGTVAWNQLIKKRAAGTETLAYVEFTKDGNGTITANGTAQGSSASCDVSQVNTDFIKDHVYYLCGAPSGGSESTYRLWVNSTTAFPIGRRFFDVGNGRIKKAEATENGQSIQFQIMKDVTVNNLKCTAQLFDLTLLFGSTIADYILSLETSTPGAGVAYFRSLFPAPFYAYNAGELMHVQTSAHKMTGFNQWDEEWEVGTINGGNGNNVVSANNIRSKNYIPALPSTTYYIGSSAADVTFIVCSYDANKNFLAANKWGSTKGTFTTHGACAFLKFATYSNYSGTYANDICINLSWDGERNGEYEPYEAHTYPLDDVELRGIPKLDANNNLYYDGDTYEADGTVTRKYGIVTYNGTEDWSNVGGSYPFAFALYANLPNKIAPVSSQKGVSNLYPWATSEVPTSNAIRFQSAGTLLYVYDYNYSSDLDGFKAMLAQRNLTIVYELATPTTEEADPYQNPQVVNDWGTEEYVDSRTVPIPVGHDTMYRANLRAKLEMLPNSPDSNGDYIVRHLNGVNTFVELIKELPTAPSTDGTYHLKCTVASGTATLTWEADE